MKETTDTYVLFTVLGSKIDMYTHIHLYMFKEIRGGLYAIHFSHFNRCDVGISSIVWNFRKIIIHIIFFLGGIWNNDEFQN